MAAIGQEAVIDDYMRLMTATDPKADIGLILGVKGR
jgi:hypothetical protein